MSFDWPHYLDVAQELTEQAKDAPPELQEAKYRAAISRAYYAVFGRARHYLRSIDTIKEPEYINPHNYVRETFMNSQDRDRRYIGANLDRMREDRNAADYDLDSDRLTNLSARARTNLKWAHDTFERLNLIQKK
jgi:uncharacterized protein (UPF0332 family)